MTHLSAGKANVIFENFQALESSRKRTVKFKTETISYRGPQIWNLIPERLRTLATLSKFEKRNKNGSVMPAYVECAKHTFNALTLITKTAMNLCLKNRYPVKYKKSYFTLKIYTADIISI